MTQTLLSSALVKQQAVASGFNIAGVIRARPALTLDAYFRWIDAGMHGTMTYLARPDRQVRRQDLTVILPDVQSLILVGLDYATNSVPIEMLNDPARGRIASYAWGADYHDVMTPRLEQFASWLAEVAGGGHSRVYVDTGAILERAHATEAGLGFVGKNTMLIHPRRGSYFFLGVIFTNLAFDDYDQVEQTTMCGTCTRCLAACPTDAFPEPYVLDARRCISYLTIEYKGMIPHELRPLMGNWVYGCDVCQDVCPWQRFVTPTHEQHFYPDDPANTAPLLLKLLALDAESFRCVYANSPILRIKRERLVRNACVAAGNWGSEDAIAPLQQLLVDESPLVRAHAAWALGQIQGKAAATIIKSAYEAERDVAAQHDLSMTLSQL